MEKQVKTVVHTLCPVCTEQMSVSQFIVDVTSKKQQREVEASNNKNVWSKEFCDECKELKSKGFILIGAVQNKTKDATNPYRSGNIWCVDPEVAVSLFAPYPPPESGVAFVDVTVAQEMKLPDVNLNA